MRFARGWSQWAWRAAPPLATAGGAAAALALAATEQHRRGACWCQSVDVKALGDAPSAVSKDTLILAVPKKGRLYEQVTALLKGAGIEYIRKERLDIAHCKNLPISIVFLPAKDIATYVAEGNIDLGITGEDILAESEVTVDVLLKLGFGKCNLSVQAPVGADGMPDVRSLAGKRIVTSFPNVTKAFFEELEEPGKPTHIKCISGSVEAACGLGLADGIVDLVETGTTMRAAGLGEVAVVMKSETVLIANPHTEHKALVELLLQRITGYQTAQSWVMVTYNICRDHLPKAEKITPGKRSPTVSPLEDKNWVSVSALVPKSKAAQIMDELAECGASDILLTGLLMSRKI